MNISVRKAEESDSALIADYLKKLAEYEKLSDKCRVTGSIIGELMREENGLCGLIAEADGVPVGIMVYYFYKIATFAGKHILYVEDVFIEPDQRRCGIGKMLFDRIKEIGKEHGCARIEWKCLDWNESAKSFYADIGGKAENDEWLTYTIDL